MDSNFQNEEKIVMNKLLKLYLLNDRKVIILFSFFKFGVVNTTNKQFTGRSIVVGLWRIELQINLSLIRKQYAKIFAKA